MDSVFGDYHAQRDYWVEVVRSAQDRGKLDTVPTSVAKTSKERRTRDVQNYWLSKKSFGHYHPNFELIKWG